MGFAVAGVGAVAFEAFVGEDGSDIEIIADTGGCVVAVRVEAGGKKEYASRDQG